MRYQEPEQSQLVRRPLAGRLGRTMLRDVNKRTMAIGSDMETLEPLQDGVLRYPPVQVQVPRDIEYINQYLDMKPIDSKKPELE